MSVDPVQQAYKSRAREYINLLGSIDVMPAEDRELISSWSADVDGLLLDVGCGPGHWTKLIHDSGVRVIGLDPVEAFIEEAAQRNPDVRYRVGRAEHLDVREDGVGGILAWYSLIHTHPDGINSAFAEFARALRPGGRLLIGYFEGQTLESFEHTVVTAWSWPTADLTHRVEEAGFTVIQTHARTNAGSRPHGALVAEFTH